jgi:peptidoglycan/xylan/chitin deacetylase (PgdA/CDA1 family)
MLSLGGWVVRGITTAADHLSEPRLSILIFHRVAPVVDPLFPNEMDVHRFDGLCAMLARDYRVFTLGHAVRLRQQGRLPPRSLAITFDDGYADNATEALPVLQRHGLAATFFVSTGFLDGGRMWNDTVIEAVRRSTRAMLDLELFSLGRVALDSLEARRAAIHALLRHVKYLGLAERQSALSRIVDVAGSPELPTDLMMRSDQVRALNAAGMEVGAHTVNHPILRVIPDRQAREEIHAGRDHLEALIGAPIDVFAYPNGGPDRDYDQRHVRMVAAAGFAAAVSTAVGVAVPAADVYQLPRFTPWDRSLSRWSLRLLAMRTRGTHFARANEAAVPVVSSD